MARGQSRFLPTISYNGVKNFTKQGVTLFFVHQKMCAAKPKRLLPSWHLLSLSDLDFNLLEQDWIWIQNKHLPRVLSKIIAGYVGIVDLLCMDERCLMPWFLAQLKDPDVRHCLLEYHRFLFWMIRETQQNWKVNAWLGYVFEICLLAKKLPFPASTKFDWKLRDWDRMRWNRLNRLDRKSVV
jgi:hypothetical protein